MVVLFCSHVQLGSVCDMPDCGIQLARSTTVYCLSMGFAYIVPRESPTGSLLAPEGKTKAISRGMMLLPTATTKTHPDVILTQTRD